MNVKQYYDLYDYDIQTNHQSSFMRFFNQVSPHQVINEASFTIKVKTNGDEYATQLLDYEKNKVYASIEF